MKNGIHEIWVNKFYCPRAFHGFPTSSVHIVNVDPWTKINFLLFFGLGNDINN